jgi:ribonuclease Z
MCQILNVEDSYSASNVSIVTRRRNDESTDLLRGSVTKSEKCPHMKVVIIGSGSSVPDPDRCASSQVVVVGNEPLLFDCGPGAGMNLMKAGISPVLINRIFLTHLHMDHCLELPSIVFGSYLMGKKNEVQLYGPAGTVDFCKLSFWEVYAYVPEIVRIVRKGELQITPTEAYQGIVCQTDSYRVLSTPVEHGLRTLAYRIETKEGTVVISGDTRPSNSVVELARGADLLIHECSVLDDEAKFAQDSYHSTASEAGAVAEQAGVERLVLTHLFPQLKGRDDEIVQSVRRSFHGEVIPSHDLLVVNV